MRGLIYLDNHATTRVDPQVIEAMMPWLAGPSNPGARHVLGKQAKDAVEFARGQVASLIGADPREIIFTSGATEANNLAIKGCHKGGKWVELTTAYEHKSVREVIPDGQHIVLFPGMDGIINSEDVEAAITDHTGLVSVMWANNEVGTLNDIPAIGAICRERGVLFHTDATQAVGKVPINVKTAGVAMLSMSSHKLHGPQGVGALYVSKSKPRVQLSPLLEGGGQERGMRSGTLNVAGIVGFGEACGIAEKGLAANAFQMESLRTLLLEMMREAFPNLQVNGSMNRLPGNLNVSIPGVHGATLVQAMGDRVALSNGSACNTGSVEPSYVLMAMGIHPTQAHEALRFGLSKFTTREEIRRAVAEIKQAVGSHRANPA